MSASDAIRHRSTADRHLDGVATQVVFMSLASLMGPGACHDLGTTWVAR